MAALLVLLLLLPCAGIAALYLAPVQLAARIGTAAGGVERTRACCTLPDRPAPGPG